jgi:quinolinate synthase
VVVYANTSAAVKARADWMVTSSCALAIVQPPEGPGPEGAVGARPHLGRYIQEQTGADMLMWNGACIVHDEFKGLELELLRRDHPRRWCWCTPSRPGSVVAQADVVGSTASCSRPWSRARQAYIVATDNGILHRMRSWRPASC